MTTEYPRVVAVRPVSTVLTTPVRLWRGKRLSYTRAYHRVMRVVGAAISAGAAVEMETRVVYPTMRSIPRKRPPEHATRQPYDELTVRIVWPTAEGTL